MRIYFANKLLDLKGHQIHITVGYGHTQMTPDELDAVDGVHVVQVRALYCAKQLGRNHLCIANIT